MSTFNLQPGMQNFHPSVNTVWGQIIQVQIAWATDRDGSIYHSLLPSSKPVPQVLKQYHLCCFQGSWDSETAWWFLLCARALAVQFCWSQSQCCASRTENLGRRVERKPHVSITIQQNSMAVCSSGPLDLSSSTPGTLQSKSLSYPKYSSPSSLWIAG